MSCQQEKQCRCDCGYRCGGPGRCELGVFECLNQTDGKHFVKDCDHQFSGPLVPDGFGASMLCQKCGLSACTHDMMVGP
jgi:hypothetical protein